MPSASDKRDWLGASPPHRRQIWVGEGCKQILIHSSLDVMKGTKEGPRVAKNKMAALYATAKHANDLDAANQIIEAIWHPPVFDELAKRVIAGGLKPIIVSPHPSFDDDDCIDHDAAQRPMARNAIPFAYAARLRIMLDAFTEAPPIVQAARVGRTKLPRFPRFLFQPHFVGDVLADRPYIIVDDNVGLGGTVAALYSHIVGNGGTVIAVSALCHSTGRNIPLSLTADTHNALVRRFGYAVDDFWKGTVGHETLCLTEGEGRFLVDWESRARGDQDQELQRLRDRLDRARATFQ